MLKYSSLGSYFNSRAWQWHLKNIQPDVLAGMAICSSLSLKETDNVPAL